MTNNTNICTPKQYAAIEKMVKGIKVTCPCVSTSGYTGSWNGSADCDTCGGFGKVYSYADLPAWLVSHGKTVLYEGCGCHSGAYLRLGPGGMEVEACHECDQGYASVLHVADALDAYCEATGGAWERVRESKTEPSYYLFYKNALSPGYSMADEAADTAAELLDKILEANHATEVQP